MFTTAIETKMSNAIGIKENANRRIFITFRNCGCMIVGPKGKDPFLEDTRAALLRHNVSHETFGVGMAKRIYPGLSYPSNYEFLLDKSGGLLMADKMLQAFQVNSSCVKFMPIANTSSNNCFACHVMSIFFTSVRCLLYGTAMFSPIYIQ